MGEGVVKTFQKMAPSDAWSRYGTSFFLNADEYKQYTSWSKIEGKNRTSAEITVFVLKNIREYKKSPLFHSIAPSGCYVTVEDYNKFRE